MIIITIDPFLSDSVSIKSVLYTTIFFCRSWLLKIKTLEVYLKSLSTAAPSYKLVLLRCGTCEWQDKNKFAGWYDSKLSSTGILQSLRASVILKNTGHNKFDIAYSSVLSRALNTTRIVLAKIDQKNMTVVKSWRLNECHHGVFTGLSKKEAGEQYG